MTDHVRAKTRKDRIMDAALRIFAEKSFQEATISEISKEAGVSEATIYEYFGTKEDLLFAIPEKISNDTFEESEAVLPYIKDVEGRMRAIMLSYIQLYQNNPDYSALVLLQLMSNKRFRQTAAHEAIRRSAHQLLDCIRNGIADGTFRSDADAYLIRSMLMGTIEHLFIHWHMQGKPQGKKSMMDMPALIFFCEDLLGLLGSDPARAFGLMLDDKTGKRFTYDQADIHGQAGVLAGSAAGAVDHSNMIRIF